MQISDFKRLGDGRLQIIVQVGDLTGTWVDRRLGGRRQKDRQTGKQTYGHMGGWKKRKSKDEGKEGRTNRHTLPGIHPPTHTPWVRPWSASWFCHRCRPAHTPSPMSSCCQTWSSLGRMRCSWSRQRLGLLYVVVDGWLDEWVGEWLGVGL